MELANWIATGSFVTGIIQAWGAIDQMRGRRGAAVGKLLTFGLGIGAALAIVFTAWLLLSEPLKPQVIERTVTVEKQIPCPPTKSGAATSRGINSPANSGSGNSTTYNQTPQSVEKPPTGQERKR
jgi:hypothetical protein